MMIVTDIRLRVVVGLDECDSFLPASLESGTRQGFQNAYPKMSIPAISVTIQTAALALRRDGSITLPEECIGAERVL